MSEKNENGVTAELGFVDILFIVLQYKNRIFGTALMVMILTFSITWLMPKWYKSTAVIVIPDKSANPLDLITGGAFSSLGGSGVLGGLGKTGNEQYLAILNSRRIKEEIVKRYGLVAFFGLDNVEEAVKVVNGLLSVEADKKLGTIQISFEFRDSPDSTAAMTSFVVQKLDEINRDLATEQASSSRIFIEKRYLQAKLDLRQAEDSLNVFQKQFGVIEISQQTEASIKAAAELYAEIVTTETEYNVLRKTVGENHPDFMRLRSKLEELRKAQSKMEVGGNNFEGLIPFKQTPDLGLRYFRLYREVQINSKILEFLVPQYEQAKIQEAKDTPTLLVLDQAQPASRHSSPKKLTISLIMGIVTVLILSAWMLFREHFLPRMDLNTNPKLGQILHSFKLYRFLK